MGRQAAKEHQEGASARRARRRPLGYHPHTFRHTAATWLTEGDVPMEKVARFLGHRDLATTQAYSKSQGSHLAGAAEVVELRLSRGRR
jgi:integrase